MGRPNRGTGSANPKRPTGTGNKEQYGADSGTTFRR